MKTEERHELKKNELSEILGKVEPYWRAIVGAIVLVVAVVIVTTLLSQSQQRARESGWTAYFAASADRNPEELNKLATAYNGTAVALWSYYSAAQGKLVEASTQVSKDRAAAKAGFEEAVAGFQKAIEQAGNYALIERQSLWGLAQAHEGLNDLAKAKDSYDQIVQKWPETESAKRAQRRIAELNDPATQEFYTWYFAQTPPTTTTPTTTAPSTTPSLPFGDAPKEPDFSIPEIGGESSAPSADDLLAPEPSTGDASSEPALDSDLPGLDNVPATSPDTEASPEGEASTDAGTDDSNDGENNGGEN